MSLDQLAQPLLSYSLPYTELVRSAFVNFLIVTVDGFPVVKYQVLLVVVEVGGGWDVVVVVVEMIRAMGTATVFEVQTSGSSSAAT